MSAEDTAAPDRFETTVDSILRHRNDLSSLAVRARDARERLHGVFGSATALAIGALAAVRPLVVVVPDVGVAESLEDDLATLAPDRRVVRLAPTAELDASVAAEPTSATVTRIPAPEERVDLSERVAHLKELAAPNPGDVFLIPAPVLLERAPATAELSEASLFLVTGTRADRAGIETRLRGAGFHPRTLVGAPGETSLRGDILDVYPYGGSRPIRIEFFDDVIESIRTFDAETQLSISTEVSVEVPLLRRDHLRGATPRATLIFERLAPELLRFFVEPRRALDRIVEHAFAHGIGEDPVRRSREFVARGAGIEAVVDPVEKHSAADLGARPVGDSGMGIDTIRDSITRLRTRCDRIVLLCESEGESQRMARLLADRGIQPGSETGLELRVGQIRAGFVLEGERVAIVNELELLGKPRLFRPRPRKNALPVRAVTTLLELRPGDHLVHQVHGVARYDGMIRMKREAGEEDFLVLAFDGGTTFYLPASKIDLVQRYVGPTGAPPRLDKIGGKSWAGKKAKVEAAMEEIAAELLEVHARRQERIGAAHPRDEAMIAEFERSFPYADTKDQAAATIEIHRDLDAPRPMDRLICGDVGFGKTEIAVRAAFRVVLGGRQVAVLVPTTLLAEQHGETFARRFASYPVKIAVLSRFRTKGEQRSVVEGLRRGDIDVVIGTHRLLSKDVGFKDLGLVVVDEEQRFGVKAKETLKRLRSAVDVLALSATPIPRTLHMALVGLRDISALSTPPVGRRPVRTEVHRFDDTFLRRAILAELDRGGQVFVIHNRVASIDAFAARIAALAPTARVVIGHGQMNEDDLDEAIHTFKDGKADVLVSTSIIESGLDLPRANTMVIDHPEHFGLADLHQMRGRVGRSDIQAFCYLLVREASLPEEARRRLEAFQELSHLGAGYEIAIKDLEIRGAGDLLSAAQSGHIGAVGYDLYCRLLARAVAKAKGERAPEPPSDTDVDLGVVAFLPAEYVPDPGQRMEILRRLGAADRAGIAALGAELRDRFGRPPAAVTALLHLFDQKRACRSHGIRRLMYPGDDHVLLELSEPRRFHKTSPFTAREAAVLSNGTIHVRLPQGVRSADAVLAWLRERMPWPPIGTETARR